jgi:DNA-binding GntR family transcriptional regulator
MVEQKAPTSRIKVVDRLVSELREAIKSGRFGPGYRLIESELTREFGASRGPVREAFNRLEAEGLIEIEPHRGATVRQMTRHDIEELFAVREILEAGAARLAAEKPKTADQRRRLEEKMGDGRKKALTGDPLVFGEANEQFHLLIVEIAGVKMLGTLVDQLQTHAYRVLFLHFQSGDRVVESASQHIDIGEAILSGDADEAEQAMRRHIRRTAEEATSMNHPWLR